MFRKGETITYIGYILFLLLPMKQKCYCLMPTRLPCCRLRDTSEVFSDSSRFSESKMVLYRVSKDEWGGGVHTTRKKLSKYHDLFFILVLTPILLRDSVVCLLVYMCNHMLAVKVSACLYI